MKRITAIIFSLITVTAHAEFWDGNKLLQYFKSSSSFEQGSALGYVMGVSDAHAGVLHCAPGNVTAGQVQDLVMSFLITNPAIRHKTADSVIFEAMSKTWPCPKRNQGRGV